MPAPHPKTALPPIEKQVEPGFRLGEFDRQLDLLVGGDTPLVGLRAIQNAVDLPLLGIR